MARNHSIEFTPEGLEILDSRPMEVPLGFQRPLTLQEEIRRMIAIETSRAAEEAGFESFEEADDFDVDDDDDEFVSPYEIMEMQDEYPESDSIASGSDEFDRQEAPGAARADEEDTASSSGQGEGAANAGGARTGDRDA